jgi:hypothetical protein
LLIGLPGVLAPFGTTILGLVAISEIRHSRGRLTGLGLAFVDAVLFPLLLMNGAIFAMIFIPLLPSNVGWQGAMGFGLAGMALIGGSLTVFLARSGWRAASAASHDSDIAAPATEGSSFGKRLSPDSLPSGESNRGPVSPVTPAEFSPGTETAPPPPPFPDLDVRRIQMELKGPAGGLLIVAALSAIYWCVLAFLLVWEAWGLQSGGFTGDPVEIILAILGGSVVLLIVAALLAGARHMRRMTGYGWAYAASILAMLPWSLAVVVGLPVGIWAFRLLRRQDVRDAFLAQAIERERARPLVRRGGRDWVTLTREQAEDDDLPDVCIVCGAPTRERLSKNFEYTPDWAGILCLFGLFPGLIAIALTQKSMRMACPVCPSDRGHWSRLVWVSSTGWVFTVPLAGIGYLIAELLGGRNEALLAGALVGAGIGLVLWLVPVIYLSSTRVSAKSISDGRITLQRVSPAFAKAVTARRMRRSGPESASVLRV